MNYNKAIIVFLWFLDILWIWIVIPTLPDLQFFYGVTEQHISIWIVMYALFAFFSAPILWQLSDIFGRKKTLTLCVLGSFLSALVIALSQSYWLFLLWRIINGITWWNISIIQATIADISHTKEDRIKNMWIMWALFGSAFIIWPLFWWLLLHSWVMTPYWFMAILSFLELLLLVFVFQETNKNISKKQINRNPIWQITKYILDEKVKNLILSFFILILAFFVYQSIMSLHLAKYYQLSWSTSGYVMTWIWVIVLLNQIFFLKQFWLKNFSLNSLLWIINIWAIIWYLFMNFAENIYFFLVFFAFLTPFQSLTNPIYQSEMIDKVWDDLRWEIMWVISSVQSVAMFVWPLLWWFLLKYDLPIFLISVLFLITNLIFVYKITRGYKNSV